MILRIDNNLFSESRKRAFNISHYFLTLFISFPKSVLKILKNLLIYYYFAMFNEETFNFYFNIIIFIILIFIRKRLLKLKTL